MTTGREVIIAAWEDDEAALALFEQLAHHKTTTAATPRRQRQFQFDRRTGIGTGSITSRGTVVRVRLVVFRHGELAVNKPDWFVCSSDKLPQKRSFTDSPRLLRAIGCQPPHSYQRKLLLNAAQCANGQRETMLRKAAEHLAACVSS